MGGNVRVVKFFRQQGAEDLYKEVESKKVFARMPSDENFVIWTTTSKWQMGYEADCHLREGLIMRVVDSKNNLIFEEKIEKSDSHFGTFARKNGPFSYDDEKNQAKKYAKALKLTPHRKWRQIMNSLLEKYNYQGYVDNWLYYEPVTKGETIIDRFESLGRKFTVVKQSVFHPICGKTWECIQLFNVTRGEPSEICGYIFKD